MMFIQFRLVKPVPSNRLREVINLQSLVSSEPFHGHDALMVQVDKLHTKATSDECILHDVSGTLRIQNDGFETPVHDMDGSLLTFQIYDSGSLDLLDEFGFEFVPEPN